MSEEEQWVYFDGPEPEVLGAALDALRDLPAATARDRERAVARFMATLRPQPAMASDESDGSAITSGRMRAGGARVGVALAAEAMEALGGVEGMEEERSAVLPPAPGVGAPESVGGAMSAPVSGPAPSRLGGTGLSLDLPVEAWRKRGELPFRPPSADPSATSAPASAKTMQLPVYRPKIGETLPLGDTSLARAVATVPFAGAREGEALVHFPDIEPMELVALQAELAVGAEPREVILKRHRVPHEASLRALLDHWGTKMGEHPALRAWYAQRLPEVTAFVRAGGRWGR